MTLNRTLVVFLTAFVAMAWAACTTEAPMTSESNAPAMAALIVKPKVPVSGSAAVLSTMRTALGNDAGVRYVRPMAGDAHVVQLTAPAQRDQIPALIERLRASGAFQYVELDSMMKIK